jgi:hypothetical protein
MICEAKDVVVSTNKAVLYEGVRIAKDTRPYKLHNEISAIRQTRLGMCIL